LFVQLFGPLSAESYEAFAIAMQVYGYAIGDELLSDRPGIFDYTQ
jgi:hypothetical protein